MSMGMPHGRALGHLGVAALIRSVPNAEPEPGPELALFNGPSYDRSAARARVLAATIRTIEPEAVNARVNYLAITSSAEFKAKKRVIE